MTCPEKTELARLLDCSEADLPYSRNYSEWEGLLEYEFDGVWVRIDRTGIRVDGVAIDPDCMAHKWQLAGYMQGLLAQQKAGAAEVADVG